MHLLHQYAVVAEVGCVLADEEAADARRSEERTGAAPWACQRVRALNGCEARVTKVLLRQ